MLDVVPQGYSLRTESLMIDLPVLTAARDRISRHLVTTPLRPALIRDYDGSEVRYKCEQVQITGSFKVRGALNRSISLPIEMDHIIAASTGNHGVACAYAAKVVGKKVTIFMPGGTDDARIQRITSLGASVRVVGSDCVDAEVAARQAMDDGEGFYISPYNDFKVIAGQGTLGLELCTQWPEMTHIFIAVGGGGLIAGVGSAIKHFLPHVKVIGCSPANSNVMHASVKAGTILDWGGTNTISKSTAGGLEAGTVTFQLCRDVVDDWIDVSEANIQHSMDSLLAQELLYVEGAAAVAEAAVTQYAPHLPKGSKVVVLLCGANR